MIIQNQEGEEENLDLPEVKEGEEDTTDWKAEAEKLKVKAIKQREQTKLLKKQLAEEKSAKAIQEQKKEEAKGFDLTQKSYLKSSGIATSEFELVESIMKETGKPIDEVVESKYFQAELKAHREDIAAKEALPSGSKRGSGTGKDSVEYWLAKGAMPPDTPENRQLRINIVNARMKVEKDKSVFTSQSVA